MVSNPNHQPKDPIERFNRFTSRVQMVGAAACALIGFIPGAVVLGAGATLDIAGNNLYKDYKARAARKLGGVVTR